jgi:DNA repair exonuclease SbcCD ATPase subunit
VVKVSFVKNLVTFGAAGRIERKIEEFEDLKYEYELLYEKMERKRVEVNDKLERLISEKVASLKSLKQLTKISKNIRQKDRDILYRSFGNEVEQINFDKINETISAGEIAMNATKGVSAGVSSALGAWALVSTFGTASTGTAIASLSGAAATNATLAWFGGGAMAFGGGGMAAGAAVLGGIVAIPALALTGIFSHMQANKKIKEIEKQMNKIIKAMGQIESNILKMELIEERTEEIITALQKTREVFNSEFKKVYKSIYPIPFISKWIKWIRKHIFRMNYFSRRDLEHIQYIGGLATDFATLIDTKVFEE